MVSYLFTQIQHDLEQRTKELLTAKSNLDDFKEKSRIKLEEEISKAQKLESSLRSAENRLSGKEGQTNDLAKELSVLQGRCNEQMKLNDEIHWKMNHKSLCSHSKLEQHK